MRLTKEELNNLSLDELKELLGAEFRKMRVDVMIDSPNKVAKAANISHKTIYNLEAGSHIPTKRTLQRILWVYRASEEDVDYVIELANLARKKRSTEIKERQELEEKINKMMGARKI